MRHAWAAAAVAAGLDLLATVVAPPGRAHPEEAVRASGERAEHTLSVSPTPDEEADRWLEIRTCPALGLGLAGAEARERGPDAAGRSAFEVQGRVELGQHSMLEVSERVMFLERMDRYGQVVSHPLTQTSLTIPPDLARWMGCRPTWSVSDEASVSRNVDPPMSPPRCCEEILLRRVAPPILPEGHYVAPA